MVLPTLQEYLAVLVCTIDRVLDGGDHIIVLGRVDTDEDHPGR